MGARWERTELTPYAGAAQVAAALAEGRVGALELLESAIARIEAIDGALNAVVLRDFDRARQAALEAEQRLARGERLPLLGVPVTVKESFAVRGLDNTWGLPMLRNRPARADSAAVQRLRNAGAVILGKTNVATVLSDWQCDNPVFGRTNNPWDMSRTPGGSSGGSAAAIAAGMSFLELGSDVAGSIRIPAHYCGVYGHRSSTGLLSSQGHMLPGTLVPSDLGALGALARKPADLALALSILAGPGEPEARAWRIELPQRAHDSLRGYRVLLLDTHPLVQTCAAVSAAVRRLGATLESAGATVADGRAIVPDLAATAECFARVLVTQNAARMPVEYASRVAYRVDAGGGERLMALGHEAAAAGSREWFAVQEARALLKRQWLQCFKDWDIVVCPSSTTNAFTHDAREVQERRLEIDGASCSYFDHLAWISAASLAGLPATQIPLGLDDSGLPVGVQAMGAPYADLSTIDFAAHVERQLGGESGNFLAPPL